MRAQVLKDRFTHSGKPGNGENEMKYSWKRLRLMFTGISILCLLVAANGQSLPQSKAQAGQSVQGMLKRPGFLRG